ncbi:MAG: HDOD domain-containing protein [Nitrospira sp.]|nr:HDOD domain-containing protein [Nitrospira sp.]
MNIQLKKHVQSISKLPTLPIVAQQILRLVDDELVSAESLEEIVIRDPVIASKIMGVANSAFYGFGSETSKIDNAIMRIGFSNVRNIALGISLMTFLDDSHTGGPIDYKTVFRHSVVVGSLAQKICSMLKLKNGSEMFINGIIHDIGYLVLAKYFPDIYSKVITCMQAESISLIEAEKRILGYAHYDIGAWLLNEWGLPESIINTTQYHHYPLESKGNRQHAALIHIADHLVYLNNIFPVNDRSDYPFEPEALVLLDITEDRFSQMKLEIATEITSIDIFGME